jgi:alpha-galactosidase
VPSSDETAIASSSNNGYPPSNAIDGRLTTIWHSEFSPIHQPLPIWLTIDTGALRSLAGLVYQPRLDDPSTGTITQYTVEISSDGVSFTQEASGTWADDRSIKSVSFPPTQARYIRLTALNADYGYASAAEVWVSDVPPS